MVRLQRYARMCAMGLVVAVTAACTSGTGMNFPVTPKAQRDIQQNGLENVEIIRLSGANIGSYSAARRVRQSAGHLSTSTRNWKYRVGVGDVLSITVWDHPELGSAAAGEQTGPGKTGVTVRADGNIFFPYIREIRVAGRDVADIQKELTTRLAEFIPDPQVSVQVAAFNSQKVVVSGEVGQPGTQKVTNIPLTLVEAVSQAGGLSANANGREVRVTREGRAYYVNLESFLRDGSRRDNPVLQGGDVVFVPDLGNNVAYVLGRVRDPGSIDLGQDGVSLTDALALKGGLEETQ
ncbi:MAG TPA: sugar ABC transporter substrate-binding protein, partial [Aliiroseovarius sp.]|nr:sugar ABC transporter substrate-binding protein [Aliiroseovarius sp.]